MVEATSRVHVTSKAKATEPERVGDGQMDVCTNELCPGTKDPETKKLIKPYERTAIRPSDMLCPKCEGRLVVKKPK